MNTHWRQARGECSAVVECSKGSGAEPGFVLNTEQLPEEVEMDFLGSFAKFSSDLGILRCGIAYGHRSMGQSVVFPSRACGRGESKGGGRPAACHVMRSNASELV